jgi:hypothetical protein
MIIDYGFVTGQSNNCQILSAPSFACYRRRPGGHLPYCSVVQTHMTLKATSTLLGTMTPECFSIKIHLLLCSYHVGETAFGNQFPAAHGDFQQTFIVPFTDFLINLYRESCSQGLFHCYLCKFLAAETIHQKCSTSLSPT